MSKYKFLQGSLLSFILFMTSTVVCCIVCALLSSCSSKVYHKQEFNVKGQKTADTKVSIHDFIMRTKADNIYVEATDAKRTLMIGKLEQMPDANSIKSIAEGVVAGIAGKIIVP